MTFLAPWMALAAAAVVLPALVLMYFLKLRRKQVEVPTTLLWRKAVQDMQASAPFQKLRRNLLLILQLLLLIGLLLALARPTVDGWSSSGRRVVIVIDNSASMNATDESPTRLEKARELARELARDASQGPGVMIVSMGYDARIVEPFTADRDRLLRAIDDIPATDEPGRLEPALTLLEQFARQESGLDIYIFSDGRLVMPTQSELQGFANVKLLRIGSDQPVNRGIVTLSARRDFQNPNRVEVFAGISNDSPNPQDVKVTVKVDGQLARVIPLTLSPTLPDQPEVSVTPMSLAMEQAGQSLVEVSLDGSDALQADDLAWVIIAPQRELRALEVGQSRRFISRALDASGLAKVDRVTPEQYESLARTSGGLGPYDIAVFDNYEPQTPPGVHALYLGAGAPAVGVDRVVETSQGRQQVVLSWQRDHPIMRYAGLDELVMADSTRLTLPAEAQALAMSSAGPLITSLEKQGRRSIVVAFDPVRSNWPLLVGFPVFMSNAMSWLGASETSETGWITQPGRSVSVPLRQRMAGSSGSSSIVNYRGPGTLSATPAGSELLIPPAGKVGVYATDSTRVDAPWDRLAVSLVDRLESDLRPVTQLVIGSQPVETVAPQRTQIRQAVQHWFLWGVLALLVVEWGVYVWRNRV